jgi:hypothetical protein
MEQQNHEIGAVFGGLYVRQFRRIDARVREQWQIDVQCIAHQPWRKLRAIAKQEQQRFVEKLAPSYVAAGSSIQPSTRCTCALMRASKNTRSCW